MSGRVAQSVERLTQEPEVPTFLSPSTGSRRAVVSYWRKYVHLLPVNPLGGLSLPRNSVVRLTDSPAMTLVVYSGRKETKQQIYNNTYSELHTTYASDTSYQKGQQRRLF